MKVKLTNVKKLPITVALFLAGSGAVYAQDVLTGDTRLACEAILCLSSGTQPGECKPSLDRYFSIWDKKPWKMIEKRINFLNLCPSSNEPNMPTLIKAIGHGAGRCDEDFLNQQLQYTYQEVKCTGRGDNETCTNENKVAISNELPQYCGTYQNHEWTYEVGVKYVGSPTLGGKWVSVRDYPAAKAEFDQKIAQMQTTRSGRDALEQAKQHTRPRQTFNFNFNSDR